MIKAERLAEAIHQVRYSTEQNGLPCGNVPWHALSLHEKALALKIAEGVLEYLYDDNVHDKDNLYKDVEKLKRTVLAVTKALSEYCE